MAEGIEGLTRDKTRKPGKQPLPTGTMQRVVDLALGPPQAETTHWTHGCWRKPQELACVRCNVFLKPTNLPTRAASYPHFKLSKDPKFAEELKDVVACMLILPPHAVVLSVDEKSQIRRSTAPSQGCR